MSNYQIQAGTLYENFETIGDWTITTGSGSVDTSVQKNSHGSLKLTSALGTNVYATKTISSNLSSAGVFYLWVYIPDSTGVNSITVYLSNDSGFTNYFSKSITGSTVHGGWNRLQVGKTEWSSTGSPSWTTTMVRLRVRVDAEATYTPIVYFSSLWYGYYSRPKVVISFDDGWVSTNDTAYPYMASYGLRGTAFIIQARIGTGGYMTTTNLQTLHDYGWDMCNHTVNHNNMTTYTQAQAEPEIGGCRDYLSSLGFTRRNEHLHLAYPNGGYNDAVLLAMTTQGMFTGRTIMNRTQANEIDEKYLLVRQYHDYTMSSATYKGFIDRAIASGGSVQINYHKIVSNGTGAASTEVEVAQFTDMIDYIAKLHHGGVIDCVTFTEWYQGLEADRKEATIYA